MRTRLRSPTWSAPSAADCETACDAFDSAATAVCELFDEDRNAELARALTQRSLASVAQTLHGACPTGRRPSGLDRVLPLASRRCGRGLGSVHRCDDHGWRRRRACRSGAAGRLLEPAAGRSLRRRSRSSRGLPGRHLSAAGSTTSAVSTGALSQPALSAYHGRTKRRPRRHVSTPGSEVALLRVEAAKRRRHLPVRQAARDDCRTCLSELKPCLMMSPLSVSHFLTADHRFDLVVFDEASQVPPQDAINCIYRGKQLIVAGDTKQLPPTPFFQVAETDEDVGGRGSRRSRARTWRASSTRARRCSTAIRLRWHYRSRHEDLIALLERAHLRRLARHVPVGRSSLTAPRRALRTTSPTGSTTAAAPRPTGARRRSSRNASSSTSSRTTAVRWV